MFSRGVDSGFEFEQNKEKRTRRGEKGKRKRRKKQKGQSKGKKKKKKKKLKKKAKKQKSKKAKKQKSKKAKKKKKKKDALRYNWRVMSSPPTKITFFQSLVPLITSGNKTITIRDEKESHYVPDTKVVVYTLETNERVGVIRIISVNPLAFGEINEFHAQQEGMELGALKKLIREVYPGVDELFVIEYELIKE